MTTLVDLRRWRIEADPVRLDPLDAPPPPVPPDGADIIVFPRIARALLLRSRRSLKRRFTSRPPSDAAGSAGSP